MDKGINSYEPQVLEHFIGQRRAIRMLKTALECCYNTGCRMPHLLMVGPPGTGKNCALSIVSRDMACELTEVLAQNITSPQQLNSLLIGMKDKDIILLDEADELKPELQTLLYKVLENNVVYISRDNKSPTRVNLNNVTVALASNNEYRLVKPLRDRCKITCRFTYYSVEELSKILRQRVKGLGWQAEEEVYDLIAQRGKLTPRVALKILESAYRTAKSRNETVVTKETLLHTFELEGLDSLGLDHTERSYLRLLKEHDGVLRVNLLASMLGIPARTLISCLEPFLIRQGLVLPSDRGRELTPKGFQYLQEEENQ